MELGDMTKTDFQIIERLRNAINYKIDLVTVGPMATDAGH